MFLEDTVHAGIDRFLLVVRNESQKLARNNQSQTTFFSEKSLKKQKTKKKKLQVGSAYIHEGCIAPLYCLTGMKGCGMSRKVLIHGRERYCYFLVVFI